MGLKMSTGGSAKTADGALATLFKHCFSDSGIWMSGACAVLEVLVLHLAFGLPASLGVLWVLCWLVQVNVV